MRAWLPRPLALHDFGPAPEPPLPLALRVARTILLTCAERPLPLRLDGQLRVEALRLLAAHLAPLDQAEANALCQFAMPLLIDLGLLAPHGADAALAPAGSRFLALTAEEQLARLRHAWIGAPRVEDWIRPQLVDMHGIDWSVLRRRLWSWASALPPARLLDPATLHEALTEAFGPLADAQTHGWRRVDRVPWWPKRAAAVWDAALRGPLFWLGAVAWAGDGAAVRCYATSLARADLADADHAAAIPEADHSVATPDRATTGTNAAWRYGAPREVIIPHAALDRVVLQLLPYARWHSADAETTTYHINARRLGIAARDGFSSDALATLLARQAGPLPPDWSAWLAPAPSVRIVYGAIVTSDEPSTLDRAARRRSVRRYLHHLAPGIALADPKRVETLSRVLGRHNLAVERRGAPQVARPSDFSPAECANLLAACDCYRHHAGGVASDSLAVLEERLRAALPFAQRLAPGQIAPSAPRAISRPLRRNQSPPARPAVTATPPPAPPDAPACKPAQAAFGGAQIVPAQPHPPQMPAPATVGPALGALWLAFAVAVDVLFTTLWRRALPGAAAEPAAATRPAAEPPPAPAYSDPRDPAGSAATAHNLPLLTRAIERRQMLQINYQAADADAPTTRIIRPLLLEWHGEHCYLHAYCTLRQAERVFRLDRIANLSEVRLTRRRGRPSRAERPVAATAPRRRPARRRVALDSGLFPPPPAPPMGSPLVRIWLAD